jgi:hypothetical protein
VSTLAGARRLNGTLPPLEKIEEAEMANARDGSPREKFVLVQDMIAGAAVH